MYFSYNPRSKLFTQFWMLEKSFLLTVEVLNMYQISGLHVVFKLAKDLYMLMYMLGNWIFIIFIIFC